MLMPATICNGSNILYKYKFTTPFKYKICKVYRHKHNEKKIESNAMVSGVSLAFSCLTPNKIIRTVGELKLCKVSAKSETLFFFSFIHS